MIRVQLFCGTCKQYVDITFPAKKIPGVAEWFNTQHSYPECTEEEDPRGQDEDEGEPAAGAPEGDAGAREDAGRKPH